MNEPNVQGHTKIPLKVYWQPGCSSCLKTKEFLIANGMEFDSINAVSQVTQNEQRLITSEESLKIVQGQLQDLWVTAPIDGLLSTVNAEIGQSIGQGTTIAQIDDLKLMIISQEKGRGTKSKVYRNFGMARPEGYRKALRLMKLAEKYNIPILTLIDTPGAYPGLGAEERGQAEAIARNLFEMSKLKVPIVNIVIGEGASGGALGIGVGDKILCFENTWYSVISPEGCASILFRDSSRAAEAADSMMVTAKDLKELGIADIILPEPEGGTHLDYDQSASTLKHAVLDSLTELNEIEPETRILNRIEKYEKMGRWSDG